MIFSRIFFGTLKLSFIIALISLKNLSLSTEWPVLKSYDQKQPAHRTILSSILGREGEEYEGGEYKGIFFVIQGNGVDRHNRQIIEDLSRLRKLLNEGHKIKISHTASIQAVQDFKKRALYKISVDGIECSYYFILYNRSQLDLFQPFQIEILQPPTPSQVITPVEIPTIHVGHGVRTAGCLSHNEISTFIRRYKNHPILSQAFEIMEDADLAVAHDLKKLTLWIGQCTNTSVSKNAILTRMRDDKTLIEQAANSFTPGADEESIYRPYVDQLHALGSQGEVCRYKGRNGIKKAMSLLNEYPPLLEGKIPECLKNATGLISIQIRIALIYVYILKREANNLDARLDELATLYPGTYFGTNQNTKTTLEGTIFFQNDIFYAPDNGYIKNGNAIVKFSLPDLSGLNISFDRTRNCRDSGLMLFSDCSGFAQFVARKFHQFNQLLQNSRQMSYHLAAVYDALANIKEGTSNLFYDINGNSLQLSPADKLTMAKFTRLIEDLKSVYEPIIDPVKNIKPGDLLIERGASEGHIMIAVEQNTENPNKVVIVELTGSGKNRGYRWRKTKLLKGLNGGRSTRVLRINH